MDIKAISNTQASINMNSQNVEALDKTKVQRVQGDQNQQVQEQQKANESVSPESIKQTIDSLNKKLEMLNSQLKVETDEDTGIRVIKIIDKEKKEVIRQIPPEVMLKIAKYLDEVTGLLFNTKA